MVVEVHRAAKSSEEFGDGSEAGGKLVERRVEGDEGGAIGLEQGSRRAIRMLRPCLKLPDLVTLWSPLP